MQMHTILYTSQKSTVIPKQVFYTSYSIQVLYYFSTNNWIMCAHSMHADKLQQDFFKVVFVSFVRSSYGSNSLKCRNTIGYTILLLLWHGHLNCLLSICITIFHIDNTTIGNLFIHFLHIHPIKSQIPFIKIIILLQTGISNG